MPYHASTFTGPLHDHNHVLLACCHVIPYHTGKAGLSCTAGPPAEPRESATRDRPIDQVVGTACPNAEVRNLRVVLE